MNLKKRRQKSFSQRERDFAALLGVTPQLLKPVLRGMGLWLTAALLAFAYLS
jgi:transcriptional regulator with XRE-family HTH domain